MSSGRRNTGTGDIQEGREALYKELFGEEVPPPANNKRKTVIKKVKRWETDEDDDGAEVEVEIPIEEEEVTGKQESHPAPHPPVSLDPPAPPPPLPPKSADAQERRTLPPQSSAPLVVSAPRASLDVRRQEAAATLPPTSSPSVARSIFGSWLGSSAASTPAAKESPRQINLKGDALKKHLIDDDLTGAKRILDQIGDIKAVLFDFIQDEEVVALNAYLLINNPDNLPRPLYAALRTKIEAHLAKDGSHYLHLAAKSGCDELLKFCFKSNLKYKINAKNFNNETPLYFAQVNKQVSSVALLQKEGAIDETVSNMTMHALFELAASADFSLADLKVALYDAKKFGFTIDKTDTNGNNLFHILARKKHKEALVFLAQCEANTYAINAKNNSNETPLSILIDQDEIELIKALEDSPASVCGDDNLKRLAYAIHVKAFNAANYFLEVDKEIVDAVGKDNISAIDEARKIEDSTIRLQLLPRLYETSKAAVAELENAISKSDKSKVRQLLDEGMKLEFVKESAQKKWQEILIQEKYANDLQEWKVNPKADHPELMLLNDNIKALSKGRHRADKELQAFVTHLYRFRDDLRAEIDGLRASMKDIKNALPPIVRAKETATFVRKLIEAEKSENSVEGVIKQARIKAIDDFAASFKRTFGWKSYAKALGVLILAAAAFVGTGAFLLLALPTVAGVTVPLYTAAASSALAGLSVFAGGTIAISRRPYLTQQGLKVSVKAREFVDASQRAAKPVLSF